MKILSVAICIFGLIVSMSSAQELKPDFRFIDDYVHTWDEFARGRNELVPKLKENGERFDAELASAIRSGDKRAPSQLVFYLVVQIGGFIKLESELGEACKELFGEDVPVSTNKEGVKKYYAGDVYYWWENDAKGFVTFSLYEEWKTRDLSKKIIPMYLRHARESREKKLEQEDGGGH